MKRYFVGVRGFLLAGWACILFAQDPAGKLLNLKINSDTISLELRQAPLGEVLDRLSEETEIDIWIHESVTSSLITLDLSAPLDTALPRLLRGFSYTISYNSGDHKISAIYVLSLSDGTSATDLGQSLSSFEILDPLKGINQRLLIESLSQESIPEEVRSALIAATQPPDTELVQTVLSSKAAIAETLLKLIEEKHGESDVMKQLRVELEKKAASDNR